MDNCANGNGAAARRVTIPDGEDGYYPPISDNRYKGLIFWWTFGELRGDPDQLARYVSRW